MKKRIASIVCAAMLMLALPTLAWADPSPAVVTGGGTSGNVTANVSFEGNLNGGALHVEPSTQKASNASGDVIATFEVYTTGDVDINGKITLTFNVGSENAGKVATVYIQHNDGSTEVQTATVAADGSITVKVDGLSYFSIALSDAKASTTSTAKATTSSKSPTTGVDMGVVAAGSVVAFAGAAVVAVALRKKVTE